MIYIQRQTTIALLVSLSLSACISPAPIDAPVRRAPPELVKPESNVTPGATSTRASIQPRPEPRKACANCPTPDPDFAPTSDEVPTGIEHTPDAVVLEEPRSRYGNPENYEALGKRYSVLRKIPKGYRETGRASWYGKKFHGRRTANGETYDMFLMTAAHKNLPIPSYARVTSKANGRSVVVRINDRGPFHPGRIVDLSYAAAARLDLLHHGSADVVLEVLTPQQGREALEGSEGKPRYLEVGRFVDPIDALALREKLARLDFTDTELLQIASPAGDGVDSVLRIGPFKSFSKLEAARTKLGLQDIPALPVAD